MFSWRVVATNSSSTIMRCGRATMMRRGLSEGSAPSSRDSRVASVSSPADRSRSVETSFHRNLDASRTRNSSIAESEAMSRVTSRRERRVLMASSRSVITIATTAPNVMPEPMPDDATVYGDAAEMVEEWRSLRDSHPATRNRPGRVEERMLALEVEMIDRFKLTLPPETYPWDSLSRADQVYWLRKSLRRVRRRAGVAGREMFFEASALTEALPRIGNYDMELGGH